MRVGLHYRYTFDLGPVFVGGGPLLTAGFARASANIASSEVSLADATTWFLAIGARLRVERALFEHVWAALEVEAMGHLRGVDVVSLGATVLGEDEVPLSAGLGVGVRL